MLDKQSKSTGRSVTSAHIENRVGFGERILRELAAIAFSDICKAVRWGPSWEKAMSHRKFSVVLAAPVAVALVLGGASSAQTQVPAFPAKPFAATITITSGQKKAAGPAAGTLGVTSLIIANFNNSTQQLFVFAPVLGGPNCASQITGGSNPSYTLILEPNRTLQLTFPTPLIFPQIGGISCIAAEVTTAQTGSVSILVNGYTQ